MVKIGINGLGVLGKTVLKMSVSSEHITVSAINQPGADTKYMENYLRYDSFYGRFSGRIEEKEEVLILGNNEISVSDKEKISDVNWENCDVVIDTMCSSTSDEYNDILKNKIKKIITVNGGFEPVLYGVKTGKEKILSYCTAEDSAVAVISKIINDGFGIENGIITTLTALDETSCAAETFNPVKWRDGRPSFNSVIPAVCGAAQMAGNIYPELKNVLSGISLKVPIRVVSGVNAVYSLKKRTNYEAVINAFETASQNEFKGLLGVTKDSVVSEDFAGCPLYTVVDARAGLLQEGKLLKITAWYDGTWNRAQGIIKYISEM